MAALPGFLRELVAAYGSFLLFRRPQANLLVLGGTLLQPWAGLCGLTGGAAALGARRLLGLPDRSFGLDGVNGVLSGLLLGIVYAPNARALVLAALGGLLSLLVTAALAGRLRLPLLSAPFCLVGAVLFAAGRGLGLGAPPRMPPWPTDLVLAGLPEPATQFLAALGSIYLTPSASAGVLMLAAFALSSRVLVLLALLGFGTAWALAALLGIPIWPAAGCAGVLAAVMLGGLYARRTGPLALAVGCLGALLAGLLALALGNAFWVMGLPALSVPYIGAIWLVMVALRAEAGAPWAGYWLATPDLPERTAEAARIATARGLDPGSVALRAPFRGACHVYQGMDGPHTHRGPWRHALDFHRLAEGFAHAGDGGRLQDYHCFGMPVLAPAAGQVLACRDDLPDQPPGDVDTGQPYGNFVMVSMAAGPVVVLAHLQQGSLGVAPGNWVALGQPLARCGSSGRSPQPHLHMHVQDGPWLGAPTRPFHLSHALVQPPDGALHYSLHAVPQAGSQMEQPVANPALAHALTPAVGRRAHFALAAGKSWDFSVELDLAGRFLLVGTGGGRIHATATDRLLAMHDRHGPADPVLDALALALGLTPFADEATAWTDVPPSALLPVPAWARGLCWPLPALASAESSFTRHWDAAAYRWEQRATHRLRLAGWTLWSCETQAWLDEAEGLLGFSLAAPGAAPLRADLSSLTLRPDRGIAGWEYRPARSSPRATV